MTRVKAARMSAAASHLLLLGVSYKLRGPTYFCYLSPVGPTCMYLGPYLLSHATSAREITKWLVDSYFLFSTEL